MTWTKALPQVEGFYWYRESSHQKSMIVSIHRSETGMWHMSSSSTYGMPLAYVLHKCPESEWSSVKIVEPSEPAQADYWD